MATRAGKLQDALKDLRIAPLRIRRDEAGEVVPVEGVTPNLMMPCVVRPLLYGQARSYESFGEALKDWSTEEKFRILKEQLVFPEFDATDAKDMEDNFDPWTLEDLVQAVFLFSGLGRLYIQDEESEGNADSEAEN